VLPFDGVKTAIIIKVNALMMETACASETSVNIYQTTPRYNRKTTRRRENFISYLKYIQKQQFGAVKE
jgi:hypothetical protein